jgi:hypothetical protein
MARTSGDVVARCRPSVPTLLHLAEFKRDAGGSAAKDSMYSTAQTGIHFIMQSRQPRARRPPTSRPSPPPRSNRRRQGRASSSQGRARPPPRPRARAARAWPSSSSSGLRPPSARQIHGRVGESDQPAATALLTLSTSSRLCSRYSVSLNLRFFSGGPSPAPEGPAPGVMPRRRSSASSFARCASWSARLRAGSPSRYSASLPARQHT